MVDEDGVCLARGNLRLVFFAKMIFPRNYLASCGAAKFAAAALHLFHHAP